MIPAPMMRGRALSIVLLLLTMLIWGSTFVITREGLRELPPMLFALLRFCVASAVLVPVAWLRGGTARLPRPVPWGRLWLMALLGVALYYVAFNLALTFTTASQGALVQSSIPVVTALMAVVWLGERLTGPRALGIGLAVAGVLLILVQAAPDAKARAPVVGNLLMFGSVLVWGGYTMLAKRLANEDALAITACVAAMGTVLLVPPALMEAAGAPLPAITLVGWLRITYLGAFPSALCYLLFSRALRDLDAGQVGAFINLIPVVGVASGVAFLGETMTPLAIVGGGLVLAGVWISTRPRATG